MQIATRNISNLWNVLGDVWSRLDDKAQIERMWEAMVSGVDYAMAKTMETQNSRSMLYMSPILDVGPQEFVFVYSGLTTNVTQLAAHEYTYALSGMIATQVVSSGIGLFSYDLENDWVITIPTFTQRYYYNGSSILNTYTEGYDYWISGMNTLIWKRNPSWDSRYPSAQTLALVAPSLQIVNPALMGLWGRALDIEIEQFNSYNTFKSNSTTNKYRHLKYFIWALTHKRLSWPTVKNFQDGIAIARGFPFAYTSGIMAYSLASGVYTATIGGESYTFPSGLLPLPTGTAINQFDVIASGLYVWDYYNNPTKITQNSNSLTQYNTVVVELVAGSGLTYNRSFYESYVAGLVPVQLRTVYKNL